MPDQVQADRTSSVEDRELVREALSRLPQRQREVILLRYFEDLSEAEIARRLGCAPGTVKSSAARALRALRDMLPDYGGTPADVPGDGRGGPSDDEEPLAVPGVSLAIVPALKSA
jgi:DNA-directed RNA polymerase specialized sigma24 family protein